MADAVAIWNGFLQKTASLPGIRVDRNEYLTKELKLYCTQEQLDMIPSKRPYAIVNEDVINRVATACIRNHTIAVTSASAVAGIPGGIAMLGTIPADLSQYYFHVLVLSQKLAYLYGFPNMVDNDSGELSDVALDMMTIFVGTVMGAGSASQAIHSLAQKLAKQALEQLPKKALTKTAIFQMAKPIAKMLGIKLTKKGFAQAVSKAIPFIGAIASGGITVATFLPGAKRLQKELMAQRGLFANEEINLTSYEKATETTAE